MRLSARGAGVLLAVPILYLAGELLGFALLRALAGAALAVLVAAVIATSRPPQVSVRREVYPDRVERGRSAMALLQVRNTGSRRHTAFVAKDVIADQRRDIAVRDLAPHTATTQRYQLPTVQRGRFTVGPLVLERTDPLGLLRRVVVTGEVAHLWVHPRRHPVRTTKAAWPRHHYDGPGSPEPLAGSTNLRQIREYVIGDEVRHVHWKAVARTGKIMVREYSDPAEPRLTVVLDNRTDGIAAGPFEEAVEIAASFVCAALAGGYRTRLVTTCGDLDVETNTGLRGARDLLDKLTVLGRVPAVSACTPTPGGATVFVGGGWASADRALLGALGPVSDVIVFDLDAHADGWPGRAALRVIAAQSAAEAIRTWNRGVAS
ncbi:MAG: DUF58 domain-containing protein [Pseudonocardiales bacterium]|nr:MAG: DUF58 domain-containing protein [Pseudonocardiales bacterium]